MRLQSSRTTGRRRRVRTSIFLGLLGLAVMLGLAKLWGPIGQLRVQSDQLTELRFQRAALVGERDDLREYKQFLATEPGQEATARRLGFVRPGERRIVFFHDTKNDAADGDVGNASEH